LLVGRCVEQGNQVLQITVTLNKALVIQLIAYLHRIIHAIEAALNATASLEAKSTFCLINPGAQLRPTRWHVNPKTVDRKRLARADYPSRIFRNLLLPKMMWT
jgi:hypothetical protein